MGNRLVSKSDTYRYVAKHGLDTIDAEAWYHKWKNAKDNASGKNVKFLLALDEFLYLAAKSGLQKPEQIGRHNGDYQLGRVGDIGNYDLDNCRFITQSQNKEEWVINGGSKATANKNLGKTKDTHESVAKAALKNSKSFILYSPEGEIFDGLNLKSFCESIGLNQGNMASVCRGTKRQYLGWTGRYK